LHCTGKILIQSNLSNRRARDALISRREIRVERERQDVIGPAPRAATFRFDEIADLSGALADDGESFPQANAVTREEAGDGELYDIIDRLQMTLAVTLADAVQESFTAPIADDVGRAAGGVCDCRRRQISQHGVVLRSCRVSRALRPKKKTRAFWAHVRRKQKPAGEGGFIQTLVRIRCMSSTSFRSTPPDRIGGNHCATTASVFMSRSRAESWRG
jgi:hypothetical protein